ncbi:hypothetical protein [Clostridium baratii]|uniref:Uncharacterized protein n=1 Tax=Clostridium baratii TaxID=1561 RepID=A0A174QNE2_9CLOT|nr:hypothetical protein [Clostridium baratii]CUP74773.1 Uncharacterised protein [Clostridium baratii]
MDQFYFNGKRSSSNFIDFRISNIKKISDDKNKENYTDYIITFAKENRKNINEFEYEELKKWLLGTHDYRIFNITGLDFSYYAKFLRLNKLQNKDSIDFKLRILNDFCYSYIITDELVAKNNTYRRNVYNWGIVPSDCNIYIEIKEDCDSLILKNTTNNNKIELNDLETSNIELNGFSLETGINEVELKVDGGRADVVINRQDRLEFKELDKYYDETVDTVR